MATTVDVVHGWTGELQFTLLADGSAQNLTGCTVTLVLKDRNGQEVDTSSDASIVTPASGIVKYAPDSADLTVTGSPYTARWKVVDAGSLVTYFPSAEPDRWIVWPA